MGLAASQVRLLAMTQRKADVEYQIGMGAMHKMALTREVSDLAREYSSKLQQKQISYYANGKYNKINYQYLMGYGANFAAAWYPDRYPMKDNNAMVLTDYKGQVVLSKAYADAINKVIPKGMSACGKGGTFDKSKIPEILAVLFPSLDAETIMKVKNGGELESSYDADIIKTLTGESVGEGETKNSEAATKMVQQFIDAYWAIFEAASTNGWTTEYNGEINSNPDYISDALVSGTFHLETIDDYGEYDDCSTLNYFVTNGDISENVTNEHREQVTAWYNEQKAILNEKEQFVDLEMQDLSTELEVIKTQMEAIQTFIDNAIQHTFTWGSNA